MSKRVFLKIFLISFFIGAVVFVIKFGECVNPFDDSWIMRGTTDISGVDNAQHYFGWVFYRNSQWNFPIGMISDMVTRDVSIIFTDSIPIVAVICKLFSPILPSTFQYLGLCSLFSYALNAAFGGVLLRKGIENDYVCIISSIIFATIPSLDRNVFFATSLLGQWTILAALCLFFFSPYKGKWKNILLWSLCIIISMGLHLYIGAMVLGIFFITTISDVVENKKWIFGVIKIVCGALASFVYLYLFGFWGGNYVKTAESNVSAGDILILFKPTNEAEYLGSNLLGTTTMPVCGYLGFGIIIGIVICVMMVIINRGIDRSLSVNKMVTCAVIVVVYYVFAITPNVCFNGELICSFELPDLINKLYGALRVNGRFIWVAMYVIYYFVVVGIYRSFRKKFIPIIIISAMIIIQIADCMGAYRIAKTRIKEDIIYENSITAEIDELIQSHDIVYMKDSLRFKYSSMYWDIINCCSKNKTQLSSYYLARENEDVVRDEKKLYDDLQNGVVHNNVLYVFTKEELELKDYPLIIYDAGDGLCFGYSQ